MILQSLINRILVRRSCEVSRLGLETIFHGRARIMIRFFLHISPACLTRYVTKCYVKKGDFFIVVTNGCPAPFVVIFLMCRLIPLSRTMILFFKIIFLHSLLIDLFCFIH